MHFDEAFDRLLKTTFIHDTYLSKLEGYNFIHDEESSAIQYADLAQGAVDATLQSTRKNNLEVMIAYGLIVESGGVMLDGNGTDIGIRPYLDWEQDRYAPVISAATLPLARQIVEKIRWEG